MRVVAAHFDTDHHEVVFSPQDAAHLPADVGHLLDKPLVDASLLSMYVLLD